MTVIICRRFCAGSIDSLWFVSLELWAGNSVKSWSASGYSFIFKHFVCIKTGAITLYWLFTVLCFFTLIKTLHTWNRSLGLIKHNLKVSPLNLQFTAIQKQTSHWFTALLGEALRLIVPPVKLSTREPVMDDVDPGKAYTANIYTNRDEYKYNDQLMDGWLAWICVVVKS